jgi:two-component system chemotaxis response regulator CheY
VICHNEGGVSRRIVAGKRVWSFKLLTSEQESAIKTCKTEINDIQHKPEWMRYGAFMDNVTSRPSATIMIVDDELFFRQMLRDILVEAGFTVVAEASDGIEAVAKYRKHRPGIIIMDIFMPEENGIAAIKKIISFDKNAKILIYTGIGFDEDVEVALQAGAKDVILKSFSPEEVMAVVNKMLTGQ